MKGKLNTSILISNNQRFQAGTEIEILNSCSGHSGLLYDCKFPTGNRATIMSDIVDITNCDSHIDWEQRRYEIAKSAMQGMLAHSTRYKPRNPNMNWHNAIAEEAKELADALIKELKKGE